MFGDVLATLLVFLHTNNKFALLPPPNTPTIAFSRWGHWAPQPFNRLSMFLDGEGAAR